MTQEARPSAVRLPIQDANDLLRAGIVAAHAGQLMHARNLLMRAIGQDAGNAVAWLWLSQVLHSSGGRKTCLEKALALNLASAEARRQLVWVRKKRAGELLRKAIAAVRTGQLRRTCDLLKCAGREYKGNALDRLRTSQVAVKKLSAATWVTVTFILTGTVIVCISLLLAGSVMAHAIPSSDMTLAAQSNRIAQVEPTQTAPPPTFTPTSIPATVEPTAQAHIDSHPTSTPLSSTPTPTVEPAPTPYPPTRIVIPSLGVDATVVPAKLEIEDVGGVPQLRWIVPEYSLAGWHETSAPLNAPGNTVINGHNWPRDAVFHNLYKIQPGEQIVLFSNHISFTYKVVEIVVLPEAGQPSEVQQANTRYIQPTDDERVTLITCHPYGSTRDRLVVIARPADS